MNGNDVIQLLFALLVASLAAFAALSPYLGRRRRKALEVLARELGWQFRPGHDYSLGNNSRFDMFRRWPSGHGFNTLMGPIRVGARTYAAQMGDYAATSARRGGRESVWNVSYVLVLVPFPRIPDVDIRREGLLDRASDAVGLDDIDFESDEFSRRYHVNSPDRRFTYDLVHPRMMEFLLKVDAPAVQARDRLVLVTDWSRWTPEGFRRKLWWVREFLDLWPEHLVTRLETGDESGEGAG
jgi:hypothetical protein